MSATNVDQLRRHSRWMGWLTLALLVATALVIIVPMSFGLARQARLGQAWPDLLLWSMVTW